MPIGARDAILADLNQLRAAGPLVHNITNLVVMDVTANALLAVGASPAMVHASEEIAEFTALAAALVLNIGTLDPRWVGAMELALEVARTRGIPSVLDPVGAGATRYRTATARTLIERGPPTILRGNAAEVAAVAKAMGAAEAATDGGQKGVDSSLGVDAARASAVALSRQTGMVVCVSGARDLVVQGERSATIDHGDPLMTKVTGLGCTATAIIGAFAAVNPDPFAATAHAMAIMGLAGERARRVADAPGSFRTAFIDALWLIGESDLARPLRISVA